MLGAARSLGLRQATVGINFALEAILKRLARRSGVRGSIRDMRMQPMRS